MAILHYFLQAAVKAVTAEAAAHPFPALTLTRGARHLAFLPGGRALVLLRGEIQHKNLWLIDNIAITLKTPADGRTDGASL